MKLYKKKSDILYQLNHENTNGTVELMINQMVLKQRMKLFAYPQFYLSRITGFNGQFASIFVIL